MRSSKGQLEAIINLIPGHVFVLDATATFIACNREQAAYFNTTPDQLVGKTLHEVFPKEIADAMVRENQEILELEETRVRDENDPYAPGKAYLVSKAPYYEDGKAVGVIGVALNISEQKRLQHELEEARQSQTILANAFRKVIDLSPANIYWYNLDNTFAGCNMSQANMFGLDSPDEVIGKSLVGLISEETAKKVCANNDKIVKTGGTLSFDENVVMPDGSERTYLSHKTAIKDANGKVTGILGVSLNVTAQDQKTRQLGRAKEQAESALENIIGLMPGYIYWVDTNNTILGMNTAQAESFSKVSSELIGQPLSSVMDAEEFVEAHQQVFSENISLTLEQTVRRGDEELVYLSQKVPIKNAHGDVIGVLSISFDITNRKSAETALNKAKDVAESANKAKAEFIANMSHDLRTPLHAILGMADMLSRQRHYPAQADLIKNIKVAGKTLLTLVEDILQFSKIEAQRLTASMADFDLAELIEDICVTVSSQAEIKGLQVVHTIASDVPLAIHTDADFLRRILLNLASNAVKFTEHGEIKVSVDLAETIDEKDIVLNITVADTGIGIPTEALEGIFNRFYRVDDTTHASQRGLGLGLSIVNEMVLQLGGTVQVESETGKGSQFHIRLPVRIADAMPTMPDDSGTNGPITLKVLLVEDDMLARNVSTALLENIGCNVATAINAREAKEKALEACWDIIFIDLGLPDGNGLDVTSELRQHKALKDMPIYALTAHASKEDERKCLAAGMTGFLVKPASFNDFKNVLLKHYQGEQE